MTTDTHIAVGRELIVVEMAGQRFAIDIMAVREIRGWTASTRLPHAPGHVLGMINLRGNVLLPILIPLIILGYYAATLGSPMRATINEPAMPPPEKWASEVTVPARGSGGTHPREHRCPLSRLSSSIAALSPSARRTALPRVWRRSPRSLY